jgi:DNA-binding PadR family transcriptional regulator
VARATPGPDDRPEDFLPLPASVMHIVVALAGGEKHGYAIMREVEDLSGGAVTMGPGTLYGSLKRMSDQGLLEETEERPDPALDDQRRRYYRLTALGVRVGAAENDRLRRLVSAADARRLGLGLGGVS